jgi:hypothetical protein
VAKSRNRQHSEIDETRLKYLAARSALREATNRPRISKVAIF